jgi:hypothetical protein
MPFCRDGVCDGAGVLDWRWAAGRMYAVVEVVGAATASNRG